MIAREMHATDKSERMRINLTKISIIVPVYNVKPYLKECIYSLISQTYKNIEIILINDGSNDGSLNICNDYL